MPLQFGGEPGGCIHFGFVLCGKLPLYWVAVFVCFRPASVVCFVVQHTVFNEFSLNLRHVCVAFALKLPLL